MSDRPDDLSPEARGARDAVRGLSRPAPDPVYRAWLRGAFGAGTITRPARRGVPAIRPLPSWRSRPWGAVLLPAAAAVLVVAGVLALDRGPAWRVIEGTGDGIAVVDHRPIPLGHRVELSRALRPGARVRLTATAPLDLALPGQMVLQVIPSTDVILPASAGRWTGREVHAEVRAGEIRITTGRHFRGARLYVKTPEAMVKVAGTTLAVIREPQGTCVCVMEGTVEMGAHGQSLVPVDAGRRRLVFSDGRAPEQDEMRPTERMKLGMFRVAHQGRMQGEGR